MGIVQYVQKEVKAVPEEQIDILVGHLNLKDPLGIQTLHLTGVRGRGVTGTVHVTNLRGKSILLLMVR